MKQTVLIFTGKHHFIPIGQNIPKGNYDEDALMGVVNKCFHSEKFDVRIIDHPKYKCFYNIDQIWKEVRLPILIGYREGANYIEPIKNFKHKYLISPLVYPNSFNENNPIDEYDDENTVCFFGGDKKSIEDAKCYEKVYEYTHSDMTEGELDLCYGIEMAMIAEALLTMANR